MKKCKGLFKKITSIGMAIVICSSMAFVQSPMRVKAEEIWPEPEGIQSDAACVIDINSGTLLYEKNADAVHYPASITKIMTALIAAENSSMDETVTFSQKAVYENEQGSSSIARDYGEQMTMEQCLYGMLLESANECAYAIAEHVGDGDCQKFVDMMNKKAKELGCQNTHFNNPNGLPDEEHYTSAKDMALIAAEAYKNPVVAKIVGTRQYTIPPTNKHVDPTPLNNHHMMLNFYKTSKWLYKYCLGGKTGYTKVANSTLVTYAKKDNMLLACVVMNTSQTAQYEDTTKLFNYYFDNFAEYTVKDSVDLNESGKTGILGKDITLLNIGDGSVIIPKTVDLSTVKAQIKETKSKSASNSKEKKAGRIEYTYANHVVGGADLLYTTNTVDTYPFHNVKKSDGGSSIPYIKIDFKFILEIIIGVLVIIGVFVFISKKIKGAKIRHPKRAKLYKRDLSMYKKIKKNDPKKRNRRKRR
ncbi:MAG: D-alanyl-D-alanine carboxypeptidase [Lachnospiraceae bacterium]|nr:D-alanyl-D-alanine carboxypeptidase [Lachnospiraceae bacterium]